MSMASAGGHKGAFAAFVCDATQLLHPGPDNVIAVRVSNAWDANLPPLDGDFTMFGGLYRPVHLLALDPLSITPLDEGGPGVYAAQTSVTPAMAELHVTAKLRNGGAAAKSASVQFQILDAADQPVQCASTERIIPADGSADAVYDISLPSPHLWNGRKDPYLYTLRVIISDGLTVVDALDQPLGLRFFAVDPDKGFLLNGQPYPLHGVNRHQDRLDMGWAIGPAEQQEDFNLIMEMGCTGIRLARLPAGKDFYDRCDRGGLVVWAEAALVNTATNSQAFDDAALQQVRELVKQNFNHPAICFWSLFNELRPTRPQADGQLDANTRHQLDLIAKLNNQAHEIDSTRLTTAASNANLPNDPLNTITDVIAYNGYFGWYAGTPASWPEYLDGLRSARPAAPLPSVKTAPARAFSSMRSPRPSPPKPRSHGIPRNGRPPSTKPPGPPCNNVHGSGEHFYGTCSISPATAEPKETTPAATTKEW